MPEWKKFLVFRLPVAMACSLLVLATLAVALVVWLVDDKSINTWDYASLERKLARLTAEPRQPQLVVGGGSLTWFGIDSHVLESQLGRKVTNFATQWQKSMYFLEIAADNLAAGDVLLIPAEYSLYPYAAGTVPPFEKCFLISHNRAKLKGVTDWADALTTCPPSMLSYGVLLRVLRASGLHSPKVDPGEMENDYGDFILNTKETAKPPTTAVDLAGTAPTPLPISLPRLERVIATARGKGAIVVLGFPPGPETTGSHLSPEWMAAFRSWATRQGAIVVSEPSAHWFPLDCFFDGSHLHRACSGENTLRYAQALKPVFKGGASR